MDLKETQILGQDAGHHWYYQSKAKALTHLLSEHSPSSILDVGAGSGFFSEYLLKNSNAKEAWCVDISYERDSDVVINGKHVYYRQHTDAINADLVLLMDVLEHVGDDVGLLKEYVDKVPSRARFLISVPAFQFLWSGHDIFLEHKRRYTLNEIEDVARRAGLTVNKGAYYFGAVFPLAAVMRLSKNWINKGRHEVRSELTAHHPVVNAILSTVCNIEMPFLAYNRLAGLTAFCLAEKP